MKGTLASLALWLYGGAFLGFVLNCLVTEYTSGSHSPFDLHLPACFALLTLGVGLAGL